MKDTIETIRNHKIRRNNMKIGKASYGGFTKKKFFKLKEGSLSFRVLPPLGTLADQGKWSMFYKVHYGYKDSQGKLRPFQSSLVINRSTKMVDVPDAALERIQKMKSQLEDAKRTNNKEMIEKLNKFVGPKGLYNLDSNHYLNVIDESGNIGILKLRHRAKLVLDSAIKKLREEGIDPLSVDNGRFFTFTRNGMGLDTTFQVEVKQESFKVEGIGMVKRDVVHKLDDEIINRLSSEAADLSTLFKALSAEEIQSIVTNGVSAIDAIFSSNKTAATIEVSEDDGYDDDTYLDTPIPANSPMAKPAPIQQATPAPVVAAPKPAAPSAAMASVTEQTDDDFLKSMGL